MSATKFWPINGTGSYMPESNTQILFSGTVTTTGVTGVAAATVTAINAIGATNVKITEIGLFLSAATGTSLTFASTYAGQTGARELRYYNGNRPAFGLDGPITAVLPTTASSLTIIDNTGKNVNFPSGSLVAGTVYDIVVNTVVTAATGSFIGLAEF